MVNRSKGIFQEVGFFNQQDFATFFSTVRAFPVLVGGDTLVTNIKSLKPNESYVLSSFGIAPSLQSLIDGSKLQEEYKNDRDSAFEKTACYSS